MGKNSNISWTTSTWNPWRGCHKLSAGCKNCFMFRDQGRFGRDPNVVVRSKTTFNDPLKWKEPALVFVCSWSDFFIEEADEWRDEAWEIIKATPHLTYQILTKRPENILDRLPKDWGAGWSNVWLGVSAENQENANRRIPLLIQIPSKVRFLSLEPLLGPIDFIQTAYSIERFHGREVAGLTYSGLIREIHWVIVGGESGPDARPMKLEWVRLIIKQCHEANIPVFVKQDSGLHPGMQGRIPYNLWKIKEFPITKVGKEYFSE